MKKLILLSIFVFICTTSHAQIFGKILDNVMDDVIDHVADKAAEEIANKIARKINHKIDESLRESYDSTQQVKYPTYEDYLTSLNENTTVPSSFEFDIWMDIESINEKKKSEMRMYFSKTSSLIGMESYENNNTSLIVMDLKNDITVMYITDEDGNKTAQVVPSFQHLSRFALKYAAKKAADDEDTYFEKTGKTKKVAGYKCDEYKGGSSDGTYKMYLAKNFPISWKQSYFGHWMQFFNEEQKNKFEIDEDAGMMLFMKSKDKKGRKSSWEVVYVEDKKTTINNKDYTF